MWQHLLVTLIVGGGRWWLGIVVWQLLKRVMNFRTSKRIMPKLVEIEVKIINL